jgi:hypothetical protein
MMERRIETTESHGYGWSLRSLRGVVWLARRNSMTTTEM